MKSMAKHVAAGVLTCASASQADILVAFPVADTALRHLGNVTLDFVVDDAGNVTLDAQSSNGGAAPQAVVNAWDGLVGIVLYAPLCNTSFTLTGVAKVSDVATINLDTDANTRGPGLGVDGTILNGAGSEQIVWIYSGAGSLNFKAVDYANRVAYGDSNLTFLDSDTRVEYMLPDTSASGSIDPIGEGVSLANSQSLIVTTDDFKDTGMTARSLNAGVSLLEVVPEPGDWRFLRCAAGAFS